MKEKWTKRRKGKGNKEVGAKVEVEGGK